MSGSPFPEVHPDTGRQLHMPPGYIWTSGGIATVQKNEALPFYVGPLSVVSLGVDATTGDSVAEVEFGVGTQMRRVSLPRSDLATVRSLVARLASLGAYVHEGNARKVMAFLNAYIATNHDALPTYSLTEHLGIQADGTIVLPHTSLGAHVRYTGQLSANLFAGHDEHAYREALREVSGWTGCWVLWALLGWSLVSPLLDRLHVRRNPVLVLAGGSNLGKTTLARFAQGAWLGAREVPFSAQGPGSTVKGLLQFVAALRGLPGTLDEAHAVPAEERLEGVIYGHANGQTYAKGGVDGRVRGGQVLSGLLVLTGENTLETRFAGAANRVLQVDVDRHLPLGEEAPGKSPVGRERAERLDQVWQRGAGHLGPQVVENILADWPGFETRVRGWQQDPDLRTHADWTHRMAALMAGLDVLLEVMDLPRPAEVARLPQALRAALQDNRSDLAPHVPVWERLAAFIWQCTPEGAARTDRVLLYRGEPVGWLDETYLYMISAARELTDRLGPGAVQKYGKSWVAEGWVVPDAKNNPTRSKYCPPKATNARVLTIPRAVLEQRPDDLL